MDPITVTVIVGLGSALLSGIVSVIISNRHYRNYEKHKMKVDTLKRFAANRYDLRGDEFTRALNEISVVFLDSPSVMQALTDFHKSIVNSKDDANERLAQLFRVMCKDVKIDTSDIDDVIFFVPFNIKSESPALPNQPPPRELPGGNPR